MMNFRYLHLLVPEFDESLISSVNRHEAISKLPNPSSMELIKNALSDQSNVAYPVYRRCQFDGKDGAKTVASGNLLIYFEKIRKHFFFVQVYLMLGKWNGLSI